nr:hypothetical protein [Paracidobacterium acidisoli]
MTGDVHDGLVAGTAFGQVRDEGVPVVVPPPFHLGIFSDVVPGRLQGGHRPSRIAWDGLAKGEDVPLGLGLAELLSVPFGVVTHAFRESSVQRDGPTFASFRLALANRQISLGQIHLRPGQVLHLGVAHARVQGKHDGWKDVRRARLLRFGEHPLLFFCCIRLGD